MENSAKRMKFLYEGVAERAFDWKVKLEEAGIPVKWEESKGILSVSPAYITRSPDIKLFVSEGDHDRASKFINDFKLKNKLENEEKIKVDGKEADRQMLWVLLVLLFFTGLLIYSKLK